MNQLQIEPRHLAIVKEIIAQNQMAVFVFGSRIKGRAKKFSDLDLCIKEDYSKRQIQKLVDDFADSNLPFKVDVVLWNEIAESFRRHIEPDLVDFAELDHTLI